MSFEYYNINMRSHPATVVTQESLLYALAAKELHDKELAFRKALDVINKEIQEIKLKHVKAGKG